MSNISGRFKHEAIQIEFEQVRSAMVAFKAAGKDVDSKSVAHFELTHSAGHSDSYPDVVTQDCWDYSPAHLEIVIRDGSRERNEIGRATVFDAKGDDQAFEMTEKIFDAVKVKLDGIATLEIS